MVKILQRGHKALREKALVVPHEDISSARVQRVLDDMRLALHAEADGVGLAAPQIGVGLRIFIVSGKIFAPKGKLQEESSDRSPLPRESVFINPVLVRKSRETKVMEEGCLSVRPYYGLVRRSVRTRIRAYDENGKLFERGAAGLLAQLFQHELDHLEGVLFSDKAESLQKVEQNNPSSPANAPLKHS